jgi:hypothetical protein
MTESEDAHIVQSDGRVRVIINGVKPEVDSGLLPSKAMVDEKVEVEVDFLLMVTMRLQPYSYIEKREIRSGPKL